MGFALAAGPFVYFIFFAMAALMTNELKNLFSRMRVEEDIVNELEKAGILDVMNFSCLVTDADSLRKLAAKSFKLDGDDLAGMAKMARFVSAWETARTRTTETTKLEAENQARGQPKNILPHDFSVLKKSFEDKYWDLSDDKTPSKAFFERRLEALEKNELRAEKLSEVVNYREDDAHELRPVWDSAGNLKAMKSATSIALPRNYEELRARLALLGTSWVLASYSQTANVLVKGLRPFLFSEYADYLLGKHVWGLTAKDAGGLPIADPTWALLLQYEHEIRIHAYFLMDQKAMSLDIALRQAWTDETVRGRYFITPLALEHRRAPPAPFFEGIPRPTKVSKKEKKMMNMGKGKGKGKAPDCAASTPDGANICFAFNSKTSECRKKNCPFEHVCGKCFRKGTPMYKCDHKSA